MPSARSVFSVFFALFVLSSSTYAGEKALIDTTRSPYAKMYMVDLADVKWNGGTLGRTF
jgi:hypothetical protein